MLLIIWLSGLGYILTVINIYLLVYMATSVMFGTIPRDRRSFDYVIVPLWDLFDL